MEQSLEFKLICDALQPKLPNIKLKIDANIDWNLLYKLAIRHRVWHQVYAALAARKNEAPVTFYNRLKQYCRQDKIRILATAAETVLIGREFTIHGIVHCFIKGIVLNISIYGDLSTRPCKDIDVWVDASTYQQAMKRLVSLGYQKILPKYELTGFQGQYHLNHRKDITFYHHKRNICVELHFRLNCPGVTLLSPTPAILKPITIFNTPIMTLQDNYHLLYLMTHGAKHGWTRLRWLNDIALYIKSGKCNLQQIMNLAHETCTEHLVEQTLILIQRNFGTEDPALSQLIRNPSQRSLKLAKASQLFMSDEHASPEDYGVIKKIKFRLYLLRLGTKKINLVDYWPICSQLTLFFPVYDFLSIYHFCTTCFIHFGLLG